MSTIVDVGSDASSGSHLMDSRMEMLAMVYLYDEPGPIKGAQGSKRWHSQDTDWMSCYMCVCVCEREVNEFNHG